MTLMFTTNPYSVFFKRMEMALEVEIPLLQRQHFGEVKLKKEMFWLTP